jgi:hypothetical protein
MRSAVEAVAVKVVGIAEKNGELRMLKRILAEKADAGCSCILSAMIITLNFN